MELNPIKQNVWKCGNALVITIPTVMAEILGISEGDTVKFLPEKIKPQEVYVEKAQEIVYKSFGIGGKSDSSEMKRKFLRKFDKYGVKPVRSKNSIYDIGSNYRIYLKYSKKHTLEAPYWFGLDPKVIQEFSNEKSKQFYIIFLAGNENNAYAFPLSDMIQWLTGVPRALDNNWKMTFTSDLKLRLSGKSPIDISRYLNNFKPLDIVK